MINPKIKYSLIKLLPVKISDTHKLVISKNIFYKVSGTRWRRYSEIYKYVLRFSSFIPTGLFLQLHV